MQEIWFVVSPHNPLKEKKSLLSEHQRLQMVRLAIEDEPKFKASDIEFSLAKPSYTIDTLVHLSEKYPSHEFVLLMGTDNISSIHKWKNYEALLENYMVYVYPRTSETAPEPNTITHKHIKHIQAPQIELSSTYIRNCIKHKKSVLYLVPDKAHAYLTEMHFYEK